MGKASAIISSIIVAIVAMATVSCNSSGCTDNQSSLPMAGFYSSVTNAAISISQLEIYGVGAPNDSVLYHSGQALTQVYLPFRSSTEKTSFVFHYTQGQLDSEEFNDTLTFTYKSIPYFASEECGAMYRYQITKIEQTYHVIDSVTMTDSLVTNIEKERIKIYFRTS